MNKDKVIKKLQILRAQNESIANTLTVLEKELAGGGAPSNSSKTKEVQEKTSQFLAKRRGRRKKAS